MKNKIQRCSKTVVHCQSNNVAIFSTRRRGLRLAQRHRGDRGGRTSLPCTEEFYSRNNNIKCSISSVPAEADETIRSIDMNRRKLLFD